MPSGISPVTRSCTARASSPSCFVSWQKIFPPDRSPLHTHSTPHLYKRFFSHTWANHSVLSPSKFEGFELYFPELPLASLLSWSFANPSAEKQPSWLCRTDGDKVTSNVPFQGASSAVAPNITSVSKPRQDTAVRKGALWHCHIWSGVTAKKTA